MKNLAFLLLSLAALPAHATDLRCESDDGAFRIEARLPDDVSWRREWANLKIDDAAITAVDAFRFDNRQTANLVAEAAEGGIQWSENSGLLAVRGLESKHLMVVQLKSWNEGTASGRLEQGAQGHGIPNVTCRMSR